jgi:hypothetical protein
VRETCGQVREMGGLSEGDTICRLSKGDMWAE